MSNYCCLRYCYIPKNLNSIEYFWREAKRTTKNRIVKLLLFGWILRPKLSKYWKSEEKVYWDKKGNPNSIFFLGAKLPTKNRIFKMKANFDGNCVQNCQNQEELLYGKLSEPILNIFAKGTRNVKYNWFGWKLEPRPSKFQKAYIIKCPDLVWKLGPERLKILKTRW